MEYSSLFVTLMGIGTVFFGLICIIFLTMAMGAILKGKEKAPAAAAAAPIKKQGSRLLVINIEGLHTQSLYYSTAVSFWKVFS